MPVQPIFRDRRDAGRKLAELLAQSVGSANVLVLALPRGGVPVAYEVARALGGDLDIFMVRKLGLPGEEELAIGAIASGGIRVLNESLIKQLQLRRDVIDEVTARETAELVQREERYRQGRLAQPVKDRIVILVDDGLATGASMKAAIQALRVYSPEKIIVAVPVAAESTCRELNKMVDEVVCAATPSSFVAVGVWYEDFAQTTDEEVQQLLAALEQRARDQSGSIAR